MSTLRSRAPAFPGGLEWFNVDGAVSLSEQRGKVVLIDFGSYCSIHCRHVLEDLRRLAGRYRNDLVIIGVHTPQFSSELRRSHVQKSINRHSIVFPVIHDAEGMLRKLYGIRTLPTQVLIDHEGYIVGALSGDGKGVRLQQVIGSLLDMRSEKVAQASCSYQLKSTPEPRGVLNFPGRIVAARDRVYISDCGNHRILVTSGNGHVLRQYGGGGQGFIDGVGQSALFNNPQGIAVNDEFLFVADEGNHAIRRINLRTDEVVTIAGTGRQGDPQDGPGATPVKTALNSPTDVVFHAGELFIAMAGAHQIWRLSLLDNSLGVLSGSGREGLADGPPGAASFAQPTGLTVCGGMLYTVDATASAVRCVDPVTGYVSTLVGDGLFSFGEQDGIGMAARLQYPLDIKADPVQNLLWVADTYNNKIRRIGVKTRHVSSIRLDRRLDEPGGLAFSGNTLYIANTNAHEVLRLNPDNGQIEALNVTEELTDF
jgi:DNA-binding beta-propeller fold protein YncE/thiol-disulfide isomerase/thioredoxin